MAQPSFNPIAHRSTGYGLDSLQADVIPQKEENPKLTQKANNKGVILYMSLSGNPTHLGHMAVVAAAIDHLREKKIAIQEVRLSLGFESYVAGKVRREDAKVKCDSTLSDQAKRRKVKVLIERGQRVDFLIRTISEANRLNMFSHVPVVYWNDQDKGESDHPDSYRRLVKENPENKIILLAGTDLADNMRWGKEQIQHAIIVTREGKHPEVRHSEGDEFSRIIVENNKYDQYKDYSSSKIQAGERLMATEEMNDEFLELKDKFLMIGS